MPQFPAHKASSLAGLTVWHMPPTSKAKGKGDKLEAAPLLLGEHRYTLGDARDTIQ